MFYHLVLYDKIRKNGREFKKNLIIYRIIAYKNFSKNVIEYLNKIIAKK